MEDRESPVLYLEMTEATPDALHGRVLALHRELR